MLECNTRQDKTIIVILGSYGKVASAIAEALYLQKQRYIAIPWGLSWNSPDLEHPPISRGGLTSDWLVTKLNEYSRIMFVDCLWSSNNAVEEESLHFEILQQIRRTYTTYSYLLVSTFEPSMESNSLYRKTKAHLEQKILDSGEQVIRIGYIIESADCNEPASQISMRIKLFRSGTLRVPVTHAKDLAFYLANLLAIESWHKSSIHRCYSMSKYLIINILPRPTAWLSSKEKGLILHLPGRCFLMHILSVIIWLIGNFKATGRRHGLLASIERMYSLLEQQPSIIAIQSLLDHGHNDTCS
jgi:hypothetical protein